MIAEQQEQIGAQRHRLRELKEEREEHIVAMLGAVEQSWHGIIEIKQQMLPDPTNMEWNEEMRFIILNECEHIREISEDESHKFHDIACKVLRDHEAWIVDHEEDIGQA